MSAYDELNAPELVKKWRALINENVTIGRDSALMKDVLVRYSPIQVMLAMYQCVGNRTISIPQFCRNIAELIEPDDLTARVELAIKVSHHTPLDYYIWQDYDGEEDADSYRRTKEAEAALRTWAERTLS